MSTRRSTSRVLVTSMTSRWATMSIDHMVAACLQCTGNVYEESKKKTIKHILMRRDIYK